MLFVPDEHLSLRYKFVQTTKFNMFNRGGPPRFKSFKTKIWTILVLFPVLFSVLFPVFFPFPLLDIFVVVLSPRFKKGLTKFMKCIDWEDEAEVAMAVELVELWEPIDVEVSADS